MSTNEIIEKAEKAIESGERVTTKRIGDDVAINIAGIVYLVWLPRQNQS